MKFSAVVPSLRYRYRELERSCLAEEDPLIVRAWGGGQLPGLHPWDQRPLSGAGVEGGVGMGWGWGGRGEASRLQPLGPAASPGETEAVLSADLGDSPLHRFGHQAPGERGRGSAPWPQFC